MFCKFVQKKLVSTAVVLQSLFIFSPAFAQTGHVRGDFTGDGSSDLVLVHNADEDATDSMVFSLFLADPGAAAGPIAQITFGNEKASDAPAIGDYDGDGLTDFGLTKVYRRKKEITWRFRTYTNTSSEEVVFGVPGDKLLSGCDFEGDGFSDLAVIHGRKLRFRNYAATKMTTVTLRTGRYRQVSCADLNGDGKDELVGKDRGTARLRRGNEVRQIRTWLLDAYSGDGARILKRARIGRAAQDGIVAADIDGDGAAEAGYYRRLKATTLFVFQGDDGLERFTLDKALIKKGVRLTDATIYDGVGSFAGIIWKGDDSNYYRSFYAETMVDTAFQVAGLPSSATAALVPFVSVRKTTAASTGQTETPTTGGAGLAGACSGGIRPLGGGFLWKPDSDVDDARGGKPVALAQGGFKLGGSVWNILASNGQKIGSLGYKPSSIPGVNGGAAHYFSGCCGGSSDTGGGLASKARSAAGNISIYVQSGSKCIGPIANPSGRQGSIS
jgi:hypothetical protein